MVLRKRNASGEFVEWNSASQSNKGVDDLPHSLPLKRQRLRDESPDIQSLAATMAPSNSGNVPMIPSGSQTPGFSQASTSSAGKAPPRKRGRPRATATQVHVPVPTATPPQPPASTSYQQSSSQPQKAPPRKRGRPKATATQVNVPVPTATPPQPTASTSYQQSSSQPNPIPPPNKGRGKKDSPAPAAEKRLERFRTKCPQNIWDRVGRVMSQRIFMIDRSRVDGELSEEFSVLGSTGNVYTVTIGRRPRCNCPDASKGNHCKHILFIFLKVLQVSQDSTYWYQKALLTSELEDIFAHAPLAPNSMAHPHIREAYARATGKQPAVPLKGTAAPEKKKRVPGPDDDCPICYDGMHGVSEASLVFCEDCGNALHKECFEQWKRTAASNGKELTCVWCRARWVVIGAPGGGAPAAMQAGGYLNLAGVGDVPRDTSSYYHGPRRGQRYYGYQRYDD